MNTIEEILKKKNKAIYETYAKEVCRDCSNRGNNKDLCKITLNLKNEAQCVNFEKCMQTKCKTCKDNLKCNI